LNAIVLRIANLSEAAIRVALRIDVDRLSGASQLGDNFVEIVDAKVDHPRVLG
jgi:hypothetical protein